MDIDIELTATDAYQLLVAIERRTDYLKERIDSLPFWDEERATLKTALIALERTEVKIRARIGEGR